MTRIVRRADSRSGTATRSNQITPSWWWPQATPASPSKHKGAARTRHALTSVASSHPKNGLGQPAGSEGGPAGGGMTQDAIVGACGVPVGVAHRRTMPMRLSGMFSTPCLRLSAVLKQWSCADPRHGLCLLQRDQSPAGGDPGRGHRPVSADIRERQVVRPARQVVPSSWVRDATTPAVNTAGGFGGGGYGHQWWDLGQPRRRLRASHWTQASGRRQAAAGRAHHFG